MSIFDPGSSFNANPWLNEKTLLALQATAAIIDLANEPDTTPWYARRLRQLALPILARLVPVVAFLYDAGQDAADVRHADAIARAGSAACAAWCGERGIRNPVEDAFPVPDDDDPEGKDDAIPQALAEIEKDAAATELRLDVYAAMARTLLHNPPSAAATRLLLWLLSELRLSEYGDIARVSKKFLPTDTGLTPEQTAAGYRELCNRGLVERVELPTLGPEGLALRLVVSGRNDSKHPLPYREEAFGYPGARVGGKRTIGNVFLLGVPGDAEGAAARLLSDDDLLVLRELLQHGLGAERAYVEAVERHGDGGTLAVRVRYPIDRHEAEIRDAIAGVLHRFGRGGRA